MSSSTPYLRTRTRSNGCAKPANAGPIRSWTLTNNRRVVARVMLSRAVVSLLLGFVIHLNYNCRKEGPRHARKRTGSNTDRSGCEGTRGSSSGRAWDHGIGRRAHSSHADGE